MKNSCIRRILYSLIILINIASLNAYEILNYFRDDEHRFPDCVKLSNGNIAVGW